MTLELGIVIDASHHSSEAVTSLAAQAEEDGLDLVVVRSGEEAGPDPWTTAVWIAGRTRRIPVGVEVAVPEPDATDPGAPYPSVVEKAQQSLDVLAGPRLVADPAAWVEAREDADAEELRAMAEGGRPVVVPVRDAAGVRRLAGLLDHRTAAPARRSAAARSRRRPGIDYDGVPESLAETAVEPGDPGYPAVRSTYLRRGAPGLVLRPRTPEEVADALAFAGRHRHLPMGVRSGGHGISGRSTNHGGLVVDVGAMNGIEVLDPARRLVRVGPGATWKQVGAALGHHGWAIGSGDYGGVGVGGLATAGGIGFLSREQGLTIDRLRAVELVLADGTRVRASADENPDLFWAARGAGANFGVATAFELEAEEVAEVGWAQLVLVAPDLEDALRRFGELAAAAPRDTTVFLVTGRPRDGQAVIQLYGMVHSSDPDVVVERLTPFAGLGMLAQQQVVLTRYADVMGLAADVGPAGHQGYGEPATRSAFLPTLTSEFAHDAAELLRGGDVHFFQLRTMGGAIADVPPDATAFAHRSAQLQVTAMGAVQAALDPQWDAMAPHFDGLYLSFETDLRPERLADAFPPPTLDRLRRLKRRYDPTNLLRDNFNIDPDVEPGSREDLR